MYLLSLKYIIIIYLIHKTILVRDRNSTVHKIKKSHISCRYHSSLGFSEIKFSEFKRRLYCQSLIFSINYCDIIRNNNNPKEKQWPRICIRYMELLGTKVFTFYDAIYFRQHKLHTLQKSNNSTRIKKIQHNDSVFC